MGQRSYKIKNKNTELSYKGEKKKRDGRRENVNRTYVEAPTSGTGSAHRVQYMFVWNKGTDRWTDG